METELSSRPGAPEGTLHYRAAPAGYAALGDRLAFWRAEGVWRHAFLRRLLATADLTAVVIALLVSGTVFADPTETLLWAALFAPVWVLLAKFHGLYDEDQRALRHLTVDEVPTIVMWALVSTAATALFIYLTSAASLQTASAARIWLLVALSAAFLRACARLVWRSIMPRDRTLIIGSGGIADATRRKLELFPDIHVSLVGQRDEVTVEDLARGNGFLEGLDRIILASPAIEEPLIAELVSFCRARRMKLSVVPPVRGMFGTAVRLNHVADLPLVEYSTWDVSRSSLLLKRALDVAVSLAVLVLLAPVFALVALAIRLDSSGPVFFVQTRAGVGGKPFRMRKFRTMVADAEARLPTVVSLADLREPVFKLRDDPRVTRVGRVLRRTSLDELPQLLNVLLGDMSLVGPRPEQLDLVARYDGDQRFRLEVKPGMTGPMQVYGRGQLTLEERLAVEREYIENLSVGRDIRILALTLPAVIGGRGAF